VGFRLIWSPTASLDLKDISAFIAEDSVSIAARFGESLLRAVERLASFPRSGRIVPEFGDPTIREVIRKPFRIVYRVDSGKHAVEIVRVWHAARGTPDVGSLRGP